MDKRGSNRWLMVVMAGRPPAVVERQPLAGCNWSWEWPIHSMLPSQTS